MIYLDNAATTKVSPEVKKAMDFCYCNIYGNPSSLHSEGLKAKEQLEKARTKIAQIINCLPEEIIFTGGGTESINLAIKGLAELNPNGHIITSTIEHPAVLETCRYLETKGCKVTYLKVDHDGLINLKDLEKAIANNTFLISVMYANNEIGTIQNIKEISSIAKKNKILFHTDACQAGSYLNLNTKELGVDLMTLNSSKVNGPKGVGLLFKRKDIEIVPLLHGGGQEGGLRSGTQNLAGIVGFAKALEIAQKNRLKESQRLIKLRNHLIEGILKKIPRSYLNGHPKQRLPNNVSVTLLDVEGESMLLYLNEKKICASTGSACSSGSLEPSHVITAIGVSEDAAHGSLRFTLGRDTKKKDIDYVLKELPKIVENLRSISPVKLELTK